MKINTNGLVQQPDGQAPKPDSMAAKAPSGPTSLPPAAASGAQSYQFSIGEPALDEALVQRVWAAGGIGSASGAAADLARYQWFYLGNPQGPARVNWLRHGAEPEPAGVLGIGSRQLLMAGQATPAGALVDFVINPKHRSAFPALMLQRNGREMALTSMQVVYGLPDTKAVMVCKRLESHVKFELPRFARVVRSRGYLERLLPRWAALPLAVFTDVLDHAGMRLQLLFSSLAGEWIEAFDARFDQLWAALDKSRLCVGVRDRAFLEWRFAQQPARNYKTFVVKRAGSDALLMYFVCEITASTLRVKDCLYIGTERELRAGLLLLTLAARTLGSHSVELQVSADGLFRRALRRAQFGLRSQRPFFAIVNAPLREQAAGLHWYITPADEDV